MEEQILKSKVIGGNDELVHDKMEIAVEKRVRLERPKKPLGSYFLFMKDLKEKGTKMSRDEATAYWKEMPADEKSKYVNQSLEMKKKYLEKLKAYEEQNPENYEDGENEGGDNENIRERKQGSLIPFARVKSILKCDEENSGKIRRDVITLIQSATEKFAANLISETIQDLRKKGKRTLNSKHIIGSLLQNFKYDFLLDSCIFDEEEIKEAESEKRNYNEGQGGKRSAKKRQSRSSNNKLLSDVIGNGKMAIERSSDKEPRASITEFEAAEKEIDEVIAKKKTSSSKGSGLLAFFNKKN